MKRHQVPAAIAAEVRVILEGAPEIRLCNLPREFHDRIERFAVILATWGARTNLTSAPEDPSEIALHTIDSLAPIFASDTFRPAQGHPGEAVKVLDLGSGAGFPGLILAAAAQARFTLVEARRRRASFLTVAAAEMGLSNITVESKRASADALKPAYDIVTSRAVGGAGLEIAAAGLKPKGIAILWLGHDQQIDIDRVGALGLTEAGRYPYTISRGAESLSRALMVLRRR